jgi:tRNA A-37 threonylcarbamoyl transferase component Bud32
MTSLSKETVLPYLADRGLVEPGLSARVEELGGGVSCVVLAVIAEGRTRLVVKQALPRLRVADEWIATPRRAVHEADALRVASRLTPGAVPRLLDSDPEASALTIECAPDDWGDWKRELLAGNVDAGVARWLGRVFATWHSGTLWDPSIESQFDDVDAFEQLRISPYHRTVAARHPELSSAIDDRVARLHRRRRCLVHGDCSPKNVLVGPGGRWVIDFEVTHYGDPTFDLAFMLNHLFLKGIHRMDDSRRYEHASTEFYDAYTAEAAPELLDEVPALMSQVGCLMLARVDGKSPAEYLDATSRQRAWEVGLSLLLDPPDSLEAAWQRLASRELQ